MNLEDVLHKLGKNGKPDEVIKLNNGELDINVLFEELVASERLLQSSNILKNYVITSTGLGLVLVPIIDLISLIGLQIKMVHSLAKHYDIPFKKGVVKSLILSLISSALGVVGVIGMSSLFKIFPVLGSLFGGATVATFSGSLTYAVGRVFIWHFEQGGTLLDFDTKKMRMLFKREIKAGKEVAEDLEASGAVTAPNKF